MATTQIPAVKPAGPPPSRRGRLRTRFDNMTPRARWLNLILILVVIIAVVLAITLIGNPSTPPVAVRTVAVTRGTVTASVTGSGNTASSVSTPVNFQGNGGTVTAVDVVPGDKVTLGEVLATVDPGTAQNGLRTAQAQLANAQAALAQAASGPTAVKSQQDAALITQAQANVTSATTAVSDAEKQLSLDTTLTQSTVSADQTKLNDDQSTTDTAKKSAEAVLRVDQANEDGAVLTAQSALNSCEHPTTTQSATTQGATTQGATTTPTPPPPRTRTPTTPTATPAAFFSQSSQPNCSLQQQAVNNAEETRSAVLQRDKVAVTAADQNQTTLLDADQAAITAAQQNGSDLELKDNQAIATAKQTLTTNQGAVTNAQLAQQADLHPSTPDQIAGFQDTVNGAQVAVDNAQLGVTQTKLLATQAGVVLAVNGKVGESSGGTNGTTANTTSSTGSTSSSTANATSAASSAAQSAGNGFITIANLSKLAVTANIAEADAAKIQLGQTATITFPATNTTATGSVTQVTPQSTVTNNVVLYPIQVSLDTAPPGVGVGSTANLTVAAASATDVLQAPNLAVTSLGNRHTVTVRRNGTDSVVPVTIGLVGDTQTEITSGVQAGDVLVLPSTGAPATGSTSSSNTGAGFPRTGG
jgi:multidrug efflux pump subunit AcrA (membrane-fusion protein)